MPAGFAFTADSRQIEALGAPVQLLRGGGITRTSLQKAIDNAGYEYSFRKNDLD